MPAKKQSTNDEDRAWMKALTEIEELGRSLSNPPLTKSTVDTMVAIAVGSMAVVQNIFPPGTIPSIRQDPIEYLRVPDAETLSVFLKQAKEVYRKTHGRALKRGRRPEEMNAFMTLLRYGSSQQGVTTQGEMVKALMEQNLSKNTAYKYAKLYHLSLRWSRGQAQFTDAERQWLTQNKETDLWRKWRLLDYLNRKRQLEEMGGSELF